MNYNNIFLESYGKGKKIIEKNVLYVIINLMKNILKGRKDKMDEKIVKEKTNKKHHGKEQILVKIMAGFLALLMLLATGGTLIYALMA